MSRICEQEPPTLQEMFPDEHLPPLVRLCRELRPRVALDIGTQTGGSAYEMANNGAQRVLTFDIINNFWITPGFPNAEKIEFHQEDLCNPEVAAKFAGDIAQCALAYIDVDPHDGQKEPLLVAALRKFQQHDIICAFDDINMNPGIRDFWTTLPDEKIELPWAHVETGFGVAILRKP